MRIEDILEDMDILLDEAWKLPGAKGMVDIEKMRDLINDVRLNYPTEVKKAREIVDDRAAILAKAKREAENIIRRAEDQAKLLVAREEIVRQAQEKSADMLTQAQHQTRQMKQMANEFVCKLLDNTDDVLTQASQQVKTTKQMLRNQMNK